MGASSATRPLIAVPAYPVRKGRVEGWVYPAAAVPTTLLFTTTLPPLPAANVMFVPAE